MAIPAGASPHKIFRIRRTDDEVQWQVDLEFGNSRRANSILVLANACVDYARNTGYHTCDVQLQTDRLGEHIVSLHSDSFEH